ncbi:MAG: ribonuclease III [Desulfovibrionaceae bacterium]|nr:ribonuclease III [Desulfovibrionaceae bacterium]
MCEDLNALQEDIHYRFGQVKLLAQALTHSSWANEQGGGLSDNERLEFLGDAVLELCVSEEAFRRYPEAPEGALTQVRSRLVKEKTLAGLARALGLDVFVRLGRGEEIQGGRQRNSLLADTLEALIGAVFLDGGFGQARALVSRLFEDCWAAAADLSGGKDFKSRLQEHTQRLNRERPVYALKNSFGPEHDKVFEVELSLPDGGTFRAQGQSLKRAEQAAARLALEHLEASGVLEDEGPEG